MISILKRGDGNEAIEQLNKKIIKDSENKIGSRLDSVKFMDKYRIVAKLTGRLMALYEKRERIDNLLSPSKDGKLTNELGSLERSISYRAQDYESANSLQSTQASEEIRTGAPKASLAKSGEANNSTIVSNKYDDITRSTIQIGKECEPNGLLGNQQSAKQSIIEYSNKPITKSDETNHNRIISLDELAKLKYNNSPKYSNACAIVAAVQCLVLRFGKDKFDSGIESFIQNTPNAKSIKDFANYIKTGDLTA